MKLLDPVLLKAAREKVANDERQVNAGTGDPAFGGVAGSVYQPAIAAGGLAGSLPMLAGAGLGAYHAPEGKKFLGGLQGSAVGQTTGLGAGLGGVGGGLLGLLAAQAMGANPQHAGMAAVAGGAAGAGLGGYGGYRLGKHLFYPQDQPQESQ